MPAITISREFGSEGSLVAEKVAQTLDYHLTDKNTIEAMLKDYGLTEFAEEYESLPGFWDRFDSQRRERRQTLMTMLNHALEALAKHGDVVIVGRGGFAVLAGLADVLNVRIQAPLALRIRRVEELPAIAEPSRAEEAVKENDRIQKAFVKTVYGVEWDTAKAFDLVIDTGKISADLAASMIIDAAKALNPPKMSGVRCTADLQVDKILASVVEDVLHLPALHMG